MPQNSDIRLVAVIGSSEKQEQIRIADASGACSGEEQEEKEEEAKKEEEENYGDGSSRPGKVVVAVAIRTPPLIALQRSTTRAMPLDRSVQIHLDFRRRRPGASPATSDTTRV